METRDSLSDTSRTDRERTRESYMQDIESGPMTLEWEAKRDREAGRPTSGTRGYADTTAFDGDRSY